MTGPAIRYWEFAKALSKKHEVTLMVPNDCDASSDDFTLIKRTASYHSYLKQMDVVITMSISHSLAWAAKMNGVKLILDAYDPLPFELLEIHKEASLSHREDVQSYITNAFNFSFRMADGIICANENQKDLWMGLLLAQKQITPILYDRDVSLKNKINIVPFGLSSTLPVKNGPGPKALFNLKQTDKIVLWGGGIWNWFDPLTLIKAIDLISKKRSDVHLVFMAVQPPKGADITNMSMPAKAFNLAKELGLFNKHVFFNTEWIPYERRANFLLEADIGISTHFGHLETRYAFRTRILDYIWAGLPIISTEGDSFARLIREKEIGLTVPYEDPEAMAQAILFILDNPNAAAEMKKNTAAVSQKFYWDEVVKPLEEMIACSLEKQSKLKSIQEILLSVYRARGVLFPFKVLKNRLFQKLGLSKVT